MNTEEVMPYDIIAEDGRAVRVKHCRDCGFNFMTSHEELNWYTQKGLKEPVRCPECRAKKRARKKQVVRQDGPDYRGLIQWFVDYVKYSFPQDMTEVAEQLEAYGLKMEDFENVREENVSDDHEA